MSSAFRQLRDYDYRDTAFRTVAVFSLAFILYVVLEGWLW
jgi:hypothetical protein